jgi:hypothetical protein
MKAKHIRIILLIFHLHLILFTQALKGLLIPAVVFKDLKKDLERNKFSNQSLSDKAIWLIDGFTPGAAAAGVSATAAAGAKPYPMIPYVGLMHNALGSELVDFYKGTESAEDALADVEAAYRTAAKEAGFLN